MGAAWEWRAFMPGVPRRPGWGEPVLANQLRGAELTWWEEQDIYLVLPGIRHNLKVRSGALEIKRWLADQPGGYSLWQDKERYDFPLLASERQALAQLLPQSRPGVPPGGRGRVPALASVDALLRWLQRRIPGAQVWTVEKRRARLDQGEVRVELAVLHLPGAGCWHSVCVDGYAREPVGRVVQEWGLTQWGRPLDYVSWLAELGWWLSGLQVGKEVSRADAGFAR